MATKEYGYVKTTHTKLLKCIRYLQNLYQLRDWEIKLDTSFKLPPEFTGDTPDDYSAQASISDDRLRALIWVPLKRLKEQDDNPHECTCHELTHIAITRCGLKGEDELLVRVLSPITYRLMCLDLGIEIGKEK